MNYQKCNFSASNGNTKSDSRSIPVPDPPHRIPTPPPPKKDS